MNRTDAVFLQGTQHTICQDYAAARPDMVCVSDGCSSSPDTDIGARIVARVWMETKDSPGSSGRMLGAALNKLELSRRLLRLPLESLDATSLLGHVDHEKASVLWMGDGVVIARKRNGEVSVLNLEFRSGAPLYLSYFMDLDRLDRYFREFPEPCELIETTYSPEWEAVDGDKTHHQPWTSDFDPEPLDFEFERSKYDLILLCSDGVLSFQERVNGLTHPVSLERVVKELLAIKVYEGEFLARRVRKMLKTTGWTHYDDFAVGAIYMGETDD